MYRAGNVHRLSRVQDELWTIPFPLNARVFTQTGDMSPTMLGKSFRILSIINVVSNWNNSAVIKTATQVVIKPCPKQWMPRKRSFITDRGYNDDWFMPLFKRPSECWRICDYERIVTGKIIFIAVVECFAHI